MKKQNPITGTLNEIFHVILHGADYVSMIATETGKSIPVVHRQLDQLVKAGMLLRKRVGKRVVYVPRWEIINDMTTSLLESELATQAFGVTAPVLPESPKKLQAAVAHVFEEEYVRSLFQQFFELMRVTKWLGTGGKKTPFETSVSLFLDVFGMLDAKQRRFVLSKVKKKESMELFLDYCKLRYGKREEMDPRRLLLSRVGVDTGK